MNTIDTTIFRRDRIDEPSDAVKRALSNVRAMAKGLARFEKLDDAEAFQRLVYADYPPEGYGTAVDIMGGARGFDVVWQIWDCE